MRKKGHYWLPPSLLPLSLFNKNPFRESTHWLHNESNPSSTCKKKNKSLAGRRCSRKSWKYNQSHIFSGKCLNTISFSSFWDISAWTKTGGLTDPHHHHSVITINDFGTSTITEIQNYNSTTWACSYSVWRCELSARNMRACCCARYCGGGTDSLLVGEDELGGDETLLYRNPLQIAQTHFRMFFSSTLKFAHFRITLISKRKSRFDNCMF